MALALTTEDKAWILDAIGDTLGALVIPAANADVKEKTRFASAVAAAEAVRAAYTGP